MRHRRHPAWIRRVSAALVVPVVLLCVDAPKMAWAYRQQRAHKDKLLDIAHKQNIDPEILLDPIGYQKHEEQRAKVRRDKALKEAAELSKPDPVKVAAAEKERAAVRAAYAPTELASIAKDIEGLRTTMAQLKAAGGDLRKRNTALNSVDGYARILSDAHEVLARYDSVEREKLKSLSPIIRQRHDKFMHEVTPLVTGLRNQLHSLVQVNMTKDMASLMAVDSTLSRFKTLHHPAPDPDRGFAMKPAKFNPPAPRTDPQLIKRMAPMKIMTPQEFDHMNQALKTPPTGGLRGLFKVPTFLTALLLGPGGTDLASTDEAPLSPEIIAKATALNHDPVQIYNFVHDTIVTEVYYGSKKGARGTLMELAGNDVDQDSLLIALLRASNIPARYEYGTVTLTPQQTMDFAGTENVNAAASALVSAGFPAQRLATGNTVTGVSIELAWVRAFIPYQNYRGAAVAPGPSTNWVHLAPSIKRYQQVNATNLVGAVPFDFVGYLSREQPKSPVDTWEDQVRAYLQANPSLNCTTLDGATKARIPIADRLPILPDALPGAVTQRLAVFSDVPAPFKHTVRILGSASNGIVEVDYNASVAALYGKPLAVQFEPATSSDATAITAHGGLESTPAYLVQLKPVLYSADQPLATGPNGDTPGENESWQVNLAIPNLPAEQPLAHLFAVGGVYAMVQDPGTLPGKLVDDAATLEQQERDAAYSADFVTAARLLSVGRRYFGSFDHGRDRVTGLYWTRYFKDTYEGSFGIAAQIQSVNGIPVSIRRNLVDIDVTRLTTTPFALSGDNSNSTSVIRLVGHNSSYLEHSTPQAFFGANQWSAVRLLGAAAQSGQTIFRIDSSNLDATLARIAVPSTVASDIRDQVAQERVVRIHSLPITPPNLPSLWGYTTENLTTGEGAYRINAQLNGGVGEDDVNDDSDAPVGPATDCAECDRSGGSRVDVANGTYYFDDLDIAVPSRGLPVSIHRTYRSSNTDQWTSLGPGWQLSYDERLQSIAGGAVVDVDENGYKWTYVDAGGGAFITPAGQHRTLTRQSDGSFLLLDRTGVSWRFDWNGRLVALSDTNGHIVQLERDLAGNLQTVIDGAGRAVLAFSYNVRGQLASVQDLAGDVNRFEYDDAGRLISHSNALGKHQSYEYDGENRLTSRCDYEGNVWSIAYDPRGRWRRTLDPLGGTRSVYYDSVNRAAVFMDQLNRPVTVRFDARGAEVSATDALGNTTASQWDHDFNLVSQTNPRGDSFAASYDQDGNLLEMVDAGGNRTTRTYGPLSRLASVTDALNHTQLYQYDAAGNMVSATNEAGETTTFGYANGLIASVTQPGGVSRTVSWDISGNLSHWTDPFGHEASFEYDAAGHLAAATDRSGAKVFRSLDANGRVLTSTDALGHTSSATYDGNGRLLTRTDANANTTRLRYDALSRLIEIEDSLGNKTRKTYDAAGQLIRMEDPNGAAWTYSYDGIGRLVSVTDAYGGVTRLGYCAADSEPTPCVAIDAMGNTVQITYDLLGRMSDVKDARGNLKHFEYDEVGRQTSVLDARGNSTHTVYDPLGRVIESIDGGGAITAYRYDARGNLAGFIDPRGKETTYSYDGANRLSESRSPNGSTTTYTYDVNGRLASTSDADGNTIGYSYDARGGLIRLTTAEGDTTFTYDALGRKVSEANESISRTMTYDSLSRPLTVTDATLGKTLTYSYDAAGNRTSATNSDGQSYRYGWDLKRRLVSAIGSDGQMTQFSYDSDDRRVGLVYPNGVSAAYQYDPNGVVSSLVWSDARREVIEAFAYQYDAVGNRIRLDRIGTSEQYGYDPAGRLASVTRNGTEHIDFQYDAIGNRVAKTDSGGSTTYSYDDVNQLVRTVAPGGRTTDYSYDGRGNLVGKTVDNAMTRYRYNSRNRLTEIDRSDGQVWRYGYDPRGMRVSIADDAAPRRVLVDLDGEEQGEYSDTDDHEGIRYERDPSKVDRVLAQVGAGQRSYFVADAQRTTYALTGSDGGVQSRYSYDVFGARSAVSETLPTAWGFTGRRQDADLIYQRQRYVDPETGRWLTRDPIGFLDGPNPYEYVHSAPTVFTDPSGLSSDVYTLSRCTQVSAHLMLLMTTVMATFPTVQFELDNNKGILNPADGQAFDHLGKLQTACSRMIIRGNELLNGCVFNKPCGRKNMDAINFLQGLWGLQVALSGTVYAAYCVNLPIAFVAATLIAAAKRPDPAPWPQQIWGITFTASEIGIVLLILDVKLFEMSTAIL